MRRNRNRGVHAGAPCLLVLVLLVGCSTTGKLTRIPDDDPLVVSAMTYARNLLKTVEPVPVEWWKMPGTDKSGEGMWCRKGVETGRMAGARTQYMPNKTKIIIYTDPKTGERTLTEITHPHEAIHAVGKNIIKPNHPEKTTTGIRLRGRVPYW